ncbi:MAG: PAS domain-containing hybrid sensor histidine kinase/response regulator [Pseudomonadota bacterium]
MTAQPPTPDGTEPGRPAPVGSPCPPAGDPLPAAVPDDPAEVARVLARAREREALFEGFIAQIPGMFYQFVRRPDGRASIPFASGGALSVMGIPAEQVVAEGEAVMRRFHPDDLPALLALIDDARRHARDWTHELRVVWPDGSEHWVEIRAKLHRQADGTLITYGFAANTDRRKAAELALRASEERQTLAAEATGLGIARLDLASGRMQLDERACRNHGLAYPQPQYSLGDWMAQIHPDDRASAQAFLADVALHGEPTEGRWRFNLPDGRQRWLEILARAECDEQGRPIGLIGTCRDVTVAQQDSQLRQQKEAAERASRAKSQFLSRVSHELRTPLNGILGFAQLMELDQAEPLPPAQRQRLDAVQRAGRHLLALINDVLDLARIEQEDFGVQDQPVQLASVLDDCLTLVQPLAQVAGVTLVPRPETDIWVRGDQRALEQVLMNLLSNAIKYNRPQGRVWIELHVSDARVRIDVCDSGLGLSSGDCARLFQPFTRLGPEPHRVEGSGLGLVIARQLTEAMHGRLDVDSEVGRGSRFIIDLPRSPNPQIGSQPAAAPPAPRASSAEPASRTVLYVEDQPLNVALVEEIFRVRQRWKLVVAGDVASALKLAREVLPDLLIIDMHLPDGDGIELLAALREQEAQELRRPVRAIALSADAMHEQIEHARRAGFADYWTKPIDVMQVLDGLDRLLGSQPPAP